jgi:hypothetical protein
MDIFQLAKHGRALPASALCLAAATILAGPASGGNRSHDDGFLLRVSVGVGAAKTSTEIVGDDLQYSGPAGDVNIAVGGMVSPNLAFHGTLMGWVINDPDVEFAGLTGGLNADLSLSALGAGLTYYFMPGNFYVSGSLGIAWLEVESLFVEGRSDAGAAFDFTFGKEWWVGEEWGLGIAGGLGLHSIPEGGIDESWKGASFGIRFSMTYN